MNYRRVIKNDLKAFGIEYSMWLVQAQDRSLWRSLVWSGKQQHAIDWCCAKENARDMRYERNREASAAAGTSRTRGVSIRRRSSCIDGAGCHFDAVDAVVRGGTGHIVVGRGSKEKRKLRAPSACVPAESRTARIVRQYRDRILQETIGIGI